MIFKVPWSVPCKLLITFVVVGAVWDVRDVARGVVAGRRTEKIKQGRFLCWRDNLGIPVLFLKS